jgi:hypothetical protein
VAAAARPAGPASWNDYAFRQAPALGIAVVVKLTRVLLPGLAAALVMTAWCTGGS